jgi:hypothetical protein
MAALTNDEYSAFVRYLRDHPEAVDELRPLFLTREVLEMPAQLARLEADSVRLREEFHAFRLEITAKTESLRQEFHAFRLEITEKTEGLRQEFYAFRLEMTEKTELLRQELLESRAETQRLFAQLAKRIDDLALQIQRHESRHGNYEGPLLEARYARNLGNWLRGWVRSPRPVVVDDLEGLASAVGAGELAEEDVDDLSRADFIISGRKPPPSAGELFAIVEISFTIDRADIDRAARRAGILSRAGYDAVAIVGGYELTADANEHARRMGVGIDLRQLAA